MRLAVWIALVASLVAAACSGPVSPPIYGRHDIDSSYEDNGPRTQRPPTNAPPDPIGTSRPGDRSCLESRDCRPGDACFAPDFEPVRSGACRFDTGCASGQVCEKSGCTAACNDNSCPLGKICHRSGHCIPVPCTEPSAATCPLNTRCNRESGNCDRIGCASRAECDSGVCFQHRCYAHDAYCMPLGYGSPPPGIGPGTGSGAPGVPGPGSGATGPGSGATGPGSPAGLGSGSSAGSGAGFPPIR